MTEDRSIPTTQPSPNKTIIFLKQFLLFSASGVTVTLLLILIAIWQGGNRFYANLSSFINPAASTKRSVEVPTVIVEQIQATSELTTATFVMEAVVPASEERKLGEIVVASTRLLYIARGEVKAGVDLSKITSEDIKITDNSIEIHLPAPQIFDRNLDIDRSFVYDYDRGFLNLGPDAAIDLQTLAQRKTLRKILKSACQKGILTEANQKAKLTVSSLLNTAGYTNIKVITSPPENNLCR